MLPSRIRERWMSSLVCAILGTMSPSTHSLTAQTLTDSDLYRSAYNANKANDYLTSAIYLFAYVQRNPVDLVNDPARATEVHKSYDFAVQSIRDALRRGESDHTRLIQLQSQQTVGSSSQGLSTAPAAPPPLRAPAAPPSRGASVAGRGRAAAAALARSSVSMDGAWKMTIYSVVSGKNYTADLVIETAAGAITGTVSIAGEGTWAIRGIDGAVGDSLDLVRDTGHRTIQHFRIGRGIGGIATGIGGRFWNVGEFADSGSVVVRR